MRIRQSHRRRNKSPVELDMTTFLNLMVVLVPFLLITAVFSRITILELTLPVGAGGDSTTEPDFRVEVIVREGGLELTDGRTVLARMPKLDEEYDLSTLSTHMISLKQKHPESNGASVLLEPQIEYDHLIQVMDTVRTASVPVPVDEASAETDAVDTGGLVYAQMALFTDIAIGDAP